MFLPSFLMFAASVKLPPEPSEPDPGGEGGALPASTPPPLSAVPAPAAQGVSTVVSTGDPRQGAGKGGGTADRPPTPAPALILSPALGGGPPLRGRVPPKTLRAMSSSLRISSLVRFEPVPIEGTAEEGISGEDAPDNDCEDKDEEEATSSAILFLDASGETKATCALDGAEAFFSICGFGGKGGF